MKILVIGATGMVGSRVVNEALARGHSVIAASRSGPADERPGVEAVALDVNDTGALQRLAETADLVVSAVSPRSSGDPVTEALAFTQSLIDAVGETRLVQVGGASSLEDADGTPLIDSAPAAYRAEALGMLKAYELLAASNADFTVLAPAKMISPGERTGKARIGDRTVVTDGEGGSEISAEDYAVVMLDEIEQPRHRRAIFNAAY